MTFTVVGQERVTAKLELELHDLMTTKAAAGLRAGAALVQARAKANLAPHHFRGRAEQQTTIGETQVTEGSISVTVGIHGGLAPEGRPLEYGWKSSGGRRPPTAAIVDWLTGSSQGASVLASATGVQVKRNKAGFITGAKARRVAPDQASLVRGLAFVIARNIGRRGFKFGDLHWLEHALRDEQQAVFEALARATRV